MVAQDAEFRGSFNCDPVGAVNGVLTRRDITFVVDLSNQLFHEVFKRDDSFHDPMFVNDNGELISFFAKRRNRVIQGLAFGDEIWGSAQGFNILPGF